MRDSTIQLGESGTEVVVSIARRANMDDITEKRICLGQIDKVGYSGIIGQTSSRANDFDRADSGWIW